MCWLCIHDLLGFGLRISEHIVRWRLIDNPINVLHVAIEYDVILRH